MPILNSDEKNKTYPRIKFKKIFADNIYDLKEDNKKITFKLKEGGVETSPTGVKFTVKNGEYYRVSGMEKGKPVIDEDQGPMTLEGVGSYEGWGSYINFDKPKPQ